MFFSKDYAQIERETRAVWVATNHHLDWPPPTFNPEKQINSLETIFDNIKTKNLNTVYFQVRSNGTVLFRSTMDPFSPYITGKVNGDSEYDPLDYAVKLAHARGLEIHAWINCVNVFSGSETNIFSNPDHICQRKPEWVIEDVSDGVKSYWLDPGLPEVREYISDMILEMVQNYDLDGVHLDYIRYPGKNFDDDFSYGIYGGGASRDDWRRNNITDLIGLINKKIKSVKPYIKLGAAPIGVYKNQKGMYAWEGYSEVYQDSHEWLKKGVLDYVVPQIYWGFEENPRFDIVASEWIGNSFGRAVILGIGAYKNNVKNQIEKMIDYSRSINSGGVAFFRYSSIKDYEFKNFGYKTFPASMAWLDGIFPEAPEGLVCEKESTDSIRFEWRLKKSYSSDSIRYFALYSLPHPNSELLPDYMFDILPADKFLAVKYLKPQKINYYFALKSVSKLWNESIESSNTAKIKYDELSDLAGLDEVVPNPVLLKSADKKFTLILFSKTNDKIIVYGSNGTGKSIIKEVEIFKGKNVISLTDNRLGLKAITIQFSSSKKEVELKF